MPLSTVSVNSLKSTALVPASDAETEVTWTVCLTHLRALYDLRDRYFILLSLRSLDSFFPGRWIPLLGLIQGMQVFQVPAPCLYLER